MLRQKQQSDRGFTLIELMIALIVIGVIAAISAPNFIGLLNRNRVKVAMNEIEGAIKEAQRQAMRQGRLCRININTSTNILTGNPSSCLFSDRQINNDIDIRTNLSGTIPNISFSYIGSTTKMGTIVVSSDGTDLQKCFVISLGTGISRTGNYVGSKTGSVAYASCQRNK